MIFRRMQLQSVIFILAVLVLNSCGGGGGSAACDSIKVSGGDTCSNEKNTIVLLEIFGQFGTNVTCTGSFISLTSILTAAHCLVDGAGQVRVTTSDGVGESAAIAYFSNGYNGSPVNDMAIIKVSPGLATQVNAKLLPLSVSSDLELGSSLFTAGFGVTENGAIPTDLKPRVAELEIVNYGPFIVAKPKDGIACVGDSGGPGIIEINGENAIVGVVSQGIGSRLCGGEKATAFADIANNIDFILSIAGDVRVID